MALLFHFAMQFYKRYKKSLYKREALAELASYKEERKDEILPLLTLAKRVGIAAYGREKIAKLSNDSWWNFMEQHSNAKVSSELRVEIANVLYDDGYDNKGKTYSDVKALVILWIKTHKGSEDV